MIVQTCRYIEGSALFKGCPRAWDAFANSDPDCCWGNNNRTLVTVDIILNALEEAKEEATDTTVRRHINTVLLRIADQWPRSPAGMCDQPYVDLEN